MNKTKIHTNWFVEPTEIVVIELFVFINQIFVFMNADVVFINATVFIKTTVFTSAQAPVVQ